MCDGDASGQLNVGRSELHSWYWAPPSNSGGSSLLLRCALAANIHCTIHTVAPVLTSCLMHAYLGQNKVCHAQVYTNAEAALAEGQLELEHSLKPPKDLQDALSKAKASLPPPPDPIQQVLGGFADAALSGLCKLSSQTCPDSEDFVAACTLPPLFVCNWELP